MELILVCFPLLDITMGKLPLAVMHHASLSHMHRLPELVSEVQ
jgi:hypothetical protein